jgi:hypothetical protein
MNRKNGNDDILTEGLSSLADDEVSEGSVSDWIRLLASDEAARERFARYRLIGAHLAGEDSVRVDASGVANRVRASLQEEPAILAPRRRPRLLHVPRLALGTALAAGVAVLAVAIAPRLIGVQQPAALPDSPSFAFAPRLSVPTDGITMVALGPQRQLPARSGAIQPGQRWKVLAPAVQQKISRYLLEHNEVAGQISAQRPSAHLGYVSTHDAQQ